VKAEALAALSGQDLFGAPADALTHAEEAVKAAPASVSAQAALARAQARVKDGVTALATADKAVQAGPTALLPTWRAARRSSPLLARRRRRRVPQGPRARSQAPPRSYQARLGPARRRRRGRRGSGGEEGQRRRPEDPARRSPCSARRPARDPKRWDDAIAQAQQGAFLNPRDPLVQMAVGQIFEAGNNIDQASLAYGARWPPIPAYTPRRVANVGVLIRKGQTDAALADAQKIVQEMPNNAQAQLQLGRLYMRKGDWQNAATRSKRRPARPGDAETQARLGTAEQYVGKKAESLAAYKKAVELDPKNVDYRTTYGLILGVNGQANAGVEELKKVVATPGYTIRPAT
jgi:Tfp pilus assembly protein PilF